GAHHHDGDVPEPRLSLDGGDDLPAVLRLHEQVEEDEGRLGSRAMQDGKRLLPMGCPDRSVPAPPELVADGKTQIVLILDDVDDWLHGGSGRGVGWGGWIRTIIMGFKVPCPALRRRPTVCCGLRPPPVAGWHGAWAQGLSQAGLADRSSDGCRTVSRGSTMARDE